MNHLTDCMFSFCAKTRRQRINQRNRVERLSPLLDWKNLGIEYSKARQLALRRAYPDAFYGPGGEGEEEEFDFGMERMTLPISVPASPRYKISGIATPGDIGTLTEEVRSRYSSRSGSHPRLPLALLPRRYSVVSPSDAVRHSQMQVLGTSDYRGYQWPSQDEEEEGYPFPLVMKVRSRANSVMSGASTPGGGRSKSLSEGDLRKADAALSNVTESQVNGNGINGH